jgi:PAS domain S-box-containing protein
MGGKAIASFGGYSSAVRRRALGIVGLALVVLCAALGLLAWHHARDLAVRDLAAGYHYPTLLAAADLEEALEALETRAIRPATAARRITDALTQLRGIQDADGIPAHAPALERLETLWRPLAGPLAAAGDLSPDLAVALAEFEAANTELRRGHEEANRRLAARMSGGHPTRDPTLVVPLLGLLAAGTLAGYGLMRGISRAALRQQELEEVLRRTEAAHERAQALARLGHWRWDIDTDRVVRSPEIYRMLGHSPETLGPTSADYFAVVHPDDREWLRARARQALEEGGELDSEHRVVRPDGDVRWVHSRAEIERDPATARPVRVDGTLHDVTERKAMEQALAESETRLRQVTEGVGEVFWVKQALGGRILYVSPAYEEIWGRSRDSLYADPASWGGAVHPDDRAAVAANLAEARDAGAPYDHTYRILRPDGTERVVRGRGYPVRDGEGRVYRWVGVAADVTALHRLQSALKESEERLRQVTETIREVFWMAIPGGGAALYVSTGYEAIWGRSRDSLYRDPDSWMEAIHPDDRERVAEVVARQGSKETEETFRIVRPDGTTRWIRNRSYPVRAAAGEVYRVVGVATDVTEQEEAKASLREQQERTRLILDSTAEGIYEVDLDGRCTFANAACARLMGYDRPEDLLGRDMHEVTQHNHHHDGSDYPAHACEVHHAIRHGHHFHAEDDYVTRADGTRLAVDFWAHPVHRDGRLVGGVMTFVDATERRRAEAERRRYQEELAHVARLSTMGEMASGLAHEINQPLAAIANFAQGSIQRLRQSNGSADAGLMESLEQISCQAARAGDIVRHLREFVGKGQGKRAPEDINSLVSAAARLIEPEAREHGVALRLELGADLPPVAVDRIQVDQVLINLMKNGVEALAGAPAPRRLTLRTRELPDGLVEVTVADNGPGLSPDSGRRLFHPFFTTKPTGLGMGLAISRSIIEAHGGRLALVENGDRGATFRFTVPVGPHDG